MKGEGVLLTGSPQASVSRQNSVSVEFADLGSSSFDLVDFFFFFFFWPGKFEAPTLSLLLKYRR